jgi:hypothetical protein
MNQRNSSTKSKNFSINSNSSTDTTSSTSSYGSNSSNNFNKTRKKREELSFNASKGVKKETVEVIISF